MSDQNDSAGKVDPQGRLQIGRYVIYWAMFSITALGVAAIIFAGNKDTQTSINNVLTAIFPVVSSWVAMILTFYFSRENFAAAAENNAAVLALTLDQKLKTIPVTDVMLPIDKANVLSTDLAENLLKLKDHLIEPHFNTGRNRLPVMTTKGVVRYVLHRSIVDKFLAENAFADGVDPRELTLKNLLDKPDYKSLALGFGVVGSIAKLSEVKALIDENAGTADVFITEDGTKNGRATGWITDAALLEKLKA